MSIRPQPIKCIFGRAGQLDPPLSKAARPAVALYQCCAGAKSQIRFIVKACIVILAVLMPAFALAEQVPDVCHLRCEMQENPLGIDVPAPALSWWLKDERRGARQTAYQILAADSEQALHQAVLSAGVTAQDTLLFDSGKVLSDQSYLVSYSGKSLASGQRVFWKVRCWDQNDMAGAYSETASWEMGLMTAPDWKGKWIRSEQLEPFSGDAAGLWRRMTQVAIRNKVEAGAETLDRLVGKTLDALRPAPMFRREFVVPGKVVRARAYICGLGFYELSINGRRVGDRLFDPPVTHYSERAFYVTYDITGQILNGTNAVGVVLGDGWYNEPMVWAGSDDDIYGEPGLLVQLEITMDDGRTMTVASDGTWKTAAGALVKNHYFAGECYDARREMSGWDTAGFGDQVWRPAVETAPFTKSLQACTMPPERVTQRLKPVKRTNPVSGVWVYDFGEVITGFAALQVKAEAGTAIVLRFSEWVYDEKYPALQETASLLTYDTFVNTNGLPGMIASKDRGMGYGMTRLPPGVRAGTPADVYICRGDTAGECWQPRFSLRQFRYVEVTGYPGVPPMDAVEGLVVHTDCPRIGSFSSSNPLFEEIYQAGLNSTIRNTHAMTWDNGFERSCTQFVTYWGAPLAVYNFDMSGFYRKAAEDQRVMEAVAGKASTLAVTRRGVAYTKHSLPGHERVSVGVPWSNYLFYGDRRELEKSYPFMKQYLDYYYRQNRYPGLIRENHTGDHLDVTSTEDVLSKPWTPKAMLTTMNMKEWTERVGQAAGTLGRTGDAGVYLSLSSNISVAVNESFYNSTERSYGGRITGGMTNLLYGSPCGNCLAIQTGVAKQDDVPVLIQHTLNDMRENYNGHIAAGREGLWRVLDALSANGRIDDAYAIMNRREYPGYGHMLSFGTKSIAEGFTFRTLPCAASACQNEFQSPIKWLHESLCGIRPEWARPAFKHFELQPRIPAELERAGMGFDSPYGRIESRWERRDGRLIWLVRVPPNTGATVWVPVGDPACVTENGVELAKVPGLQVLRRECDAVVAELVAGTYHFDSDLRRKSK